MTAGAVEIRYSKPVEFPKVLTVERGYAPLRMVGHYRAIIMALPAHRLPKVRVLD